MPDNSSTFHFMKNKLFIFLIIASLLFISCNKKNAVHPNETIKTDTVETVTSTIIIAENPDFSENLNWQEGFGLTHNIDKDSIWKKPVRFYIENKDCSQTAIDFYFGKYSPTDESKTAALLNLVLTENSELRPFYRWILNKTIQIQDGALAEYTGKPARKYAEKFPEEFFDYMDFDPSGEKYKDWYNSILYSGYYDHDDYGKPHLIRAEMVKRMSENCSDCNTLTLKRINKFANDCFPDLKNEKQ